MPRLKGSGWLVNFDYIRKTYGEDSVGRVIDSMSEEDQVVLKKTLLPISWGPDFTVFMRFILAADKLLGQGDYKLLSKAAAFHMQRDTSLYTIFFKVLTTEFVMKNIPKVWRQYFEIPGNITVDIAAPKHMRMRLKGFDPMPINHEKYHNGYLEEILRKTGAKQFQIEHPKCLGRNDDECIFEATWR